MLLSEFVEEGSLEDYVARRAAELGRPWRPPMERVLRWAQDLAQAVCFLHKCDPVVIHRDLKPSNLLLCAGDRLKVGDFGLSRVKAAGARRGRRYLMTGRTGTLRYMAPEVMRTDGHGMCAYDERVDIFSSGMILWFMCMGERPYGDIRSELVVVGTAQGLRPDLFCVRKRAGAEMANVIEGCWATRPADRFTAEALLVELRRIRAARAHADAARGLGAAPRRLARWVARAACRATRVLAACACADAEPVAAPDRRRHPAPARGLADVAAGDAPGKGTA